MIVSRLRGGLGNQLFQYAVGRALAHKHQSELRLDISAFDADPLRSYALDRFRLSAQALTREERERLGLSSPPKGRIGKVLGRIFGSAKVPLVRERRFEFDPTILDAPEPCCLEGYWQSPKYFAAVEPLIRSECIVREPLGGVNLELSAQIEDCVSVSLHVRRGDYIGQAHTNRYHGTCGPEYYAAAETLLRERLGELRLYVFSDEPDWAEANLRFSSPATFLRHNDAQHDYEDLRLMSLCRHHIIANSTFSWWGAWLCAQPDKLVVAPKNWFSEADLSTADLIPDNWMRI